MKIKGAKVCISIGAESLSAYSSLCERAVCAGDVVELRVDYLHKIEFEKLSELIRSVPCETILTFRPKEQGGMSNASLEERIRFWSKAKKLPATFFDFELDLVLALKDDKEIDWQHVIVSHHDFEKTPDDLETLYETMSLTPARILKIATQANDANDCIKHFRLLERAKKDGRKLIAIAMGEVGKITRILAPFLTYAALDDEQATAPGQITAKELRETYRMDEISMDIKIYGLVGHSVSHSVSPEMHNAAFRHHGINAMYWTHDTKDISTFVEWLREKVFLNWRGASVTIPHKQTVMKHLDWIDETAKEIGAVNAIVIENNLLLGYNTDAKGFIEPLKNFYSDLRGARCAVIGAGGAARAVAWALKKESADITIFARDIERARKKFDVNAERLGDSKFSSFDIVINTTPLGTKGKLENETPATAEQLYGIGLVYDLVYNPLTTRFILEAQSVDVPTIGGLEMLVAQAAEQSKLWTGLDAPIDVMRKAAMEKLNG
jgi:3-dehydroquinate dehydratase/shikimate dehydrogenase